MKKVKFQIINHTDGEPLYGIYTCEVLREDNTECKTVYLKRKAESIIRIADIVMQPRKIYFYKSGKTLMTYGIPKGKSWSQGSFSATIKIISTEE